MADSKHEVQDHQPEVETPKEIATPKAAEKASPDERRAAMAQENAVSMAPLEDDRERRSRSQRAGQMAQENAVSMAVLSDDDEREARTERAAQMARENAGV